MDRPHKRICGVGKVESGKAYTSMHLAALSSSLA